MTDTTDPRRGLPWRLIGCSIPAVLLSLPLVTGAPWTLSDYFVMGAMFLIAGLGIELAFRASGDAFYRAGALVAVASLFLLLWVNLAVGFLGSEANPANLAFFAVPAVALAAALVGHFRSAAMARTMVATAGCQALVAAVALAAGGASAGSDGLYEVALGTALFGGLWLTSAWLFARSAARTAASA